MAVVKANKTETITGHKAVRAALRDTEKYSSDLQGDADVRDYRQIPLEIDPPRHHLYRSALSPFFVKPTVEKCVPDFHRNATALITEFFSHPGLDVTSDLALPVVMQNLGVLYNRPQDVAEWIEWGPDVWTATGEERDGATLHAYIDRVYAEALASDVDDVWHHVARLEIDGKVISATEFKGIAGVLLAGGRDTVIKLITGMVWYLGNHSAEIEAMRNDRSLIDAAVQEFLRFFTPLPEMARTIVPETGATNLPEDRYVGVSFISGNFDETVFENPFEISFNRERNPHLSFGFGPHTCLGNHLAEIEAKVFLNALLDTGYTWVIAKEEIAFHAGHYSPVPDRFITIELTKLG
jgi:cytochrome P450